MLHDAHMYAVAAVIAFTAIWLASRLDPIADLPVVSRLCRGIAAVLAVIAIVQPAAFGAGLTAFAKREAASVMSNLGESRQEIVPL